MRVSVWFMQKPGDSARSTVNNTQRAGANASAVAEVNTHLQTRTRAHTHAYTHTYSIMLGICEIIPHILRVISYTVRTYGLARRELRWMKRQ